MALVTKGAGKVTKLAHPHPYRNGIIMGSIARLKGEEPSYFKTLFVEKTEGRGAVGEYLTEYALEHGKLGDSARVFRNVLVPKTTGATNTSEIDVLMLHEKGIFVFESKNYSGWIFGSEDQFKWTCSLAGGHKERFYNPILHLGCSRRDLRDRRGVSPVVPKGSSARP